MLPLTLRSTVQFGEDGRNVQLVIVDSAEDMAAEATAAFDAGDFTLQDLLGATSDYATVEIHEAGEVTRCTGQQFNRHRVVDLCELADLQPLWTRFEDLEPAAP